MTSNSAAQASAEGAKTMADELADEQGTSDGSTRLAYILGVPLADDAIREWPQMGEVVRGRDLIGAVEGNFEELTLAVGERRRFGQFLVVEWSNDYGDGAIYRNVTIAQIEDGEAVRVTDYWGGPFQTPQWRKAMTDRLEMPPDGRWPSADRLLHR
jgi:hypothetical protein